VYWLMVALQSRGIPFERVIGDMERPEKDEPLDEIPDLMTEPDWTAELQANVRRIREAVKTGDLFELNGMGYLLNEGVNNASVALVDRSTELNTAFRAKGADVRAATEAADALTGIICLCELAGVNFDEVMDKEMGK
jgi:phosphoribosyl-ATP pyrophosphohydrolase